LRAGYIKHCEQRLGANANNQRELSSFSGLRKLSTPQLSASPLGSKENMEEKSEIRLREAIKVYWKNVIAMPISGVFGYFVLKYVDNFTFASVISLIGFFLSTYYAALPYRKNKVNYTFWMLICTVYPIGGLILIILSNLILKLLQSIFAG
jgi:ABC-type multidrug transport system permease subunit